MSTPDLFLLESYSEYVDPMTKGNEFSITRSRLYAALLLTTMPFAFLQPLPPKENSV